MIAEAARQVEAEAKERARAEREKEDEKKRKAATKAKPKAAPIKYPTEDLDVRLTEREKKQGREICRPALERSLPFSASFESFLMSWTFFITYGWVLQSCAQLFY